MSLKLAILGFLDIEASTGYTLGQRFSGSVGSFWTATQSQIYRELHDLEERGMVSLEVIPQDGKPPRKVYSLNEEGRRELAKIKRGPFDHMAMRDPFMLRFVFSADVEPETLDGMLAQFQDELKTRRNEYVERQSSPAILSLARSDRERTLWELSLEQGIRWCDQQIEWLAEARRKLRPGQ